LKLRLPVVEIFTAEQKIHFEKNAFKLLGAIIGFKAPKQPKNPQLHFEPERPDIP